MTRSKNGGHPQTRKEAGENFPVIVAGGRYRLRNGTEVVVAFNRSADPWAQLFPWTQAGSQLGEKMFWRSNGCYGANWVGHEFDIMRRVR